jgi:hypothetical protein
MMAFTTLLIAVPIIILLYMLIIKRVKKTIINYIIVFIISVLFMITGSLHLIYIGLEIILLGLITVWIKSTIELKRSTKFNNNRG